MQSHKKAPFRALFLCLTVAPKPALAYASIMKHAWLLLLIFMLPAQAEIYRWVDDDGNVVFSDEPHANAEKIEVSPSTVYTPQENIQGPDEGEDEILKLSPDDTPGVEEAEPAVPAYQLRIIAPAHDESIWVNNGNVTVNMIVEPQLDAERGDRVLLQLDGAPVGEPQSATTFQLNNLSRGTHSLSAQVVDNNGSMLTSSGTVTFHLHRASVLNRPAQNPGQNPAN